MEMWVVVRFHQRAELHGQENREGVAVQSEAAPDCRPDLFGQDTKPELISDADQMLDKTAQTALTA